MTDQPAEPSLAGLPLTGLLDELIGWSDRLHARITFPDAEDRVNVIRATILARYGDKHDMLIQSQSDDLYKLTMLAEFHEGRNALAPTETDPS